MGYTPQKKYRPGLSSHPGLKIMKKDYPYCGILAILVLIQKTATIAVIA